MATTDGEEMAKEGGAGQETHEGESTAKRQEAEEATEMHLVGARCVFGAVLSGGLGWCVHQTKTRDCLDVMLARPG